MRQEMTKEELEIGHVYHVGAPEGIAVAVWDGSSFIGIGDRQKEVVTRLGHYEEGWPLGVVRPYAKISDNPLQLSGINVNTIRLLIAVNNLAQLLSEEAEEQEKNEDN